MCTAGAWLRVMWAAGPCWVGGPCWVPSTTMSRGAHVAGTSANCCEYASDDEGSRGDHTHGAPRLRKHHPTESARRGPGSIRKPACGCMTWRGNAAPSRSLAPFVCGSVCSWFSVRLFVVPFVPFVRAPEQIARLSAFVYSQFLDCHS